MKKPLSDREQVATALMLAEEHLVWCQANNLVNGAARAAGRITGYKKRLEEMDASDRARRSSRRG